jgi:hypothetical protein
VLDLKIHATVPGTQATAQVSSVIDLIAPEKILPLHGHLPLFRATAIPLRTSLAMLYYPAVHFSLGSIYCSWVVGDSSLDRGATFRERAEFSTRLWIDEFMYLYLQSRVVLIPLPAETGTVAASYHRWPTAVESGRREFLF